MNTIYLRPYLTCPKCASRANAKEVLVMISSRFDNAHGVVYELDLADDMTGLSLICEECSHQFEVHGVDVLCNDGQKLEY